MVKKERKEIAVDKDGKVLKAIEVSQFKSKKLSNKFNLRFKIGFDGIDRFIPEGGSQK
jgi:hypothetical protein